MIFKQIGLTTYDLLPTTETVKSKQYIIALQKLSKNQFF